MTRIFTAIMMLYCSSNFAQSPTAFKIEKSGTVNLLEASKKPDQWYISLKKIKAHKPSSSLANLPQTGLRTAATTPTLPNNLRIDASFPVPVLNDAYPPDEGIAVGNNGKVLTASNSALIAHSETGTTVASLSWDSFAGAITSNNLFFDPRVVYDPVNDRFIVVILNGSAEDMNRNPNYDSRIIVGFSQTNDPAGSYNLYKIELTNIVDTFEGDFFDYESIGISSGKLFIATNTSHLDHIWKLDLSEGYAGNSSVTTSIVDFELDFADSQRGEMFFIHNYNMNQDNFVYALAVAYKSYEIFDIALIRLSDNSSKSEEVLLGQHKQYLAIDHYPSQPDGLELSMGERYFSGFVHNEKLTFSYAFSNNGKRHIYLNDIDLDGTDFSNSALGNNMAILDFSNIGLGYIEMVPVSCDGEDCDMILLLQTASASEYLTSKVAFINRNNAFSTPITVKRGTSNNDDERVGDYIDIQKRYNESGEAWLIGQYVFQHDEGWSVLGDWVAQVSVDGVLSIIEPPKPAITTKVFPNPSSDFVSIKIKGIDGRVSVNLYDVRGNHIKHLITTGIGSEDYQLSFNIAHLKTGVYFLRIADQSNKVLSTKIVKK
jgi:hypothetical protein